MVAAALAGLVAVVLLVAVGFPTVDGFLLPVPWRGRAGLAGALAGWPVGETCVMSEAIACGCKQVVSTR